MDYTDSFYKFQGGGFYTKDNEHRQQTPYWGVNRHALKEIGKNPKVAGIANRIVQKLYL